MAPPSERETHPELFLPDRNIDRRTCQRVVPMEVLSLGMSRTGTHSMQTALRHLGYHETYHFFSLYSNPRDCEMWHAALDAKYSPPGTAVPFTRADWDRLLGHCAAVTDLPAICFAPELLAAYPHAKVVLVRRDPDAWFASFDATVASYAFRPGAALLARCDPRFLGPIASLSNRVLTEFFRSASREELRAKARGVYEEHYELVRRLVPRERLLEVDLGEGWEPLCKFLGKEVPDVPFPRGNETAVMRAKLRIVMRRGAVAVVWNALVAAVGVLAVGVAVWCFLWGCVG